MSLIKPGGNMYTFVDWIWNPVKGMCPYACSYCYVEKTIRQKGKTQNPLHLDEKDLRTNLGKGNFIFICSGCDLFHPDVPGEWIQKVIDKTSVEQDNTILWHTKNPERAALFEFPSNSILCTTLETNRDTYGISKASAPCRRAFFFHTCRGVKRMVTIEPIIDFDLMAFVELVTDLDPIQVNIGADSWHNGLPEPTPEKIAALIAALRPFTKVHLKENLERLYKETA
jgi:DNA repair photolyase